MYHLFLNLFGKVAKKNKMSDQEVLPLQHVNNLPHAKGPVHWVEIVWNSRDQTLVPSFEQHIVLDKTQFQLNSMRTRYILCDSDTLRLG